jgi:hypothetical protein
MKTFITCVTGFAVCALCSGGNLGAAEGPGMPIPAALGVPKPGPTNDAPYAPQPILQGGIVVPLYPPDSAQLNQNRVREAEYYNVSKAVPGRISWITNIHNPSIEVHLVEGGLNTGAAIIWASNTQRWIRERGFCALLLQLRREHDHPAEPAAGGRLQRAEQRGE